MQHLRQQSVAADERCDLLTVPQQHGGQRSRSFDSAGNDESTAAFLEVPKRFQRRRSSNSKTPPPCIHCQYLEDYEREVGADKRFFIDHNEVKSLSYSDQSSSDEDDDSGGGGGGVGGIHIDDDHTTDEDEGPRFGNLLLPPVLNSPGITFTLSPTNGGGGVDFLGASGFPGPFVGSPPASPCFPPSPTIEFALFDEALPPTSPSRQRRRSISRQEAIFVEPTGSSLENVADAAKENDRCREGDVAERLAAAAANGVAAVAVVSSTDYVQDIYLTVPDLKRDRAASVDSCFSKVSSGGKTEELQPPDGGFTLTVPVNSCATRSRSVDIVLPTNEQARYKALAMAGPAAASYLNRGYVFRHF